MSPDDITPTIVPIRCTPEMHEALRADVELFKAATVNHARWDSLFVGNCAQCSSTLALVFCSLGCDEPCPSGDCLPVGKDGEHGHFACLARKALESGKTRYVIIAGAGAAREFVRGGMA